MNLFIAEKPSLAKTIAKHFGIKNSGQGFYEIEGGAVTWCLGHMYENYAAHEYDLKYKRWVMEDLPIIPDEILIKIKSDCVGQIEIIHSLANDCDVLVNCADPDREGQLLVDEVIENIEFDGEVKRAWLKDLSDSGLKKSLNNLQDNSDYQGMCDSAKARSHLDWMVGINLTRIYTLHALSRGANIKVLSVGRVQTPTMKLVVDRDKQIENFKSQEYYEIIGNFEIHGQVFQCKKLIDEDHKDVHNRCIDKTFIESEIKRLNGINSFSVLSIEKKNRKERSPLPFSLGDLQTECSKALGLSAQEVLDIAQSLYATHKITSYPRSDCNYLSVGEFDECVETVKALSGEYQQYLSFDYKPACFNDKKVTAHTAIIPNGKTSDKLNDDEKNVYEIICKRFFAQFAEPYKFSETILVLENSDDQYSAKGKIEIDLGFKHILKPTGKKSASQKIPDVKKSDEVDHKSSEIVIKHTTPPKRFTDGTLIKAMGNIAKHLENGNEREILKDVGGIGTEATRASIIETLKDRGYLVLEKKNLISTDRARNFIKLMIDQIKSPVLTAQWEMDFAKIEGGELTYDEFIGQQKLWVQTICDQAKNSDISIFGGTPCPSCKDGFQVIKKGKKSQFIGCTLYPECDFTKFPKSTTKNRKSFRRKK